MNISLKVLVLTLSCFAVVSALSAQVVPEPTAEESTGLAGTNLFTAPVVVDSPDGRTSISFEVKDGALFYSVLQEGRPVVSPSKVEIFTGAHMVLVDYSVRENDTSWKPVLGAVQHDPRSPSRADPCADGGRHAGETALPCV